MGNNKRIAIIGGGSSAHTLISLLSDQDYSVNLYTRNPDKWQKKIVTNYTSEDGLIYKTFTNEVNLISNNIEEVINDAEFIVLCMPVYNYREALSLLAPYINKNKKTFIGTLYGQAGFNWMIDEQRKKYNWSESSVIAFTFGLIPWICRIVEYGSIGITYGPKAKNYVALSKTSEFEYLYNSLLKKITVDSFNTGEIKCVDNFISLTLSVDNQIIHTSRCYSLYKTTGCMWESQKDVPLFYKHYDEESAICLQNLDDDYSSIRDRIKKDYPFYDYSLMLNYLDLERFSYNTCNENIKESFTLSKTLGAIETPVVKTDQGFWTIDKSNRFFTDDIYYGVCIAKWFAEELNIDVPMIDEILYWAQELLEVEILINNKLNRKFLNYGTFSGIPSSYGLTEIGKLL